MMKAFILMFFLFNPETHEFDTKVLGQYATKQECVEDDIRQAKDWVSIAPDKVRGVDFLKNTVCMEIPSWIQWRSK